MPKPTKTKTLKSESTELVAQREAAVGQLFSITKVTVQIKLDEFKPLIELKTVNDQEQADKVRAARLALKSDRCEVDNQHEAAKEPILKLGRLIDARRNELVGMIKPSEDKLGVLEDRWNQEQERLKREAEERRINFRFLIRTQRLDEVGGALPHHDYRLMSDEMFEQSVEVTRTHHEQEAERLRLKKIADDQAAERKRLEDDEAARREREAAEELLRESAAQAPTITELIARAEGEESPTVIRVYCIKCGVLGDGHLQKYCGDGSDKDDAHRFEILPVSCPNCGSTDPDESPLEVCRHSWHRQHTGWNREPSNMLVVPAEVVGASQMSNFSSVAVIDHTLREIKQRAAVPVSNTSHSKVQRAEMLIMDVVGEFVRQPAEFARAALMCRKALVEIFAELDDADSDR